MTTIVNIPSPHPTHGIKNEDVINYIEPLKMQEKVQVSGAYSMNLNQHLSGQPPIVRPGYKYYFWFEDADEAEEFRAKFDGEIVTLNT